MWILPIVGYLGVITGFLFLTLAIASGLYYLSELVEEHSVVARRVLYRLIYTIIGAHVLLYLVDHLPFLLCALSISSHLVYASNLRRFPFVKLSDPLFLTSCVLVGFNHWLWSRHFSDPIAMAHRQSRLAPEFYHYDAAPELDEIPTFTQIASYFGLCVWLVPFALFVSLSAADNVLPSMNTETPSSTSVMGANVRNPESGSVTGQQARNKGMFKAMIDGASGWMNETGELLGVRRPETKRTF